MAPVTKVLNTSLGTFIRTIRQHVLIGWIRDARAKTCVVIRCLALQTDKLANKMKAVLDFDYVSKYRG